MKSKFTVGVLVCIFCLGAASHAAIIEAIEIAQTNAASAVYDGQDTITWSGGALGSVITGGFKYDLFNEVALTATITGLADNSSGGIAQATFDTCTDFSLSLLKNGDLKFQITGTLPGLYYEGEVVDGEGLDGRMIMAETSVFIEEGYFKTAWGLDPQDQVVWSGGTSGLFGVGSSILFSGFNLDDYATAYSSNNTTITVYADESAIPEPATMALLGLGALLLRKRRA